MSITIYLVIAFVLLAWPVRRANRNIGSAADELDKLVAGGALIEPAAPLYFQARDGERRLYRLYESPGTRLLILLHGSGSDSRYLARLARTLSANITVATLDLRGHGPLPVHRGDVDRIEQQEEDIDDLLLALETGRKFDRFFLGGHSIGGGLAIRYAAGNKRGKPDGLVLIAPYIDRRSPAARRGSGGWATPFITRFAGIDMLQRVGIRSFDQLPVIRFEMSPAAKDGTETLLYSWRLFTSVTPRNDWRKEVRKIRCPLLVLAAQNDSIFRSDGYQEIFADVLHASVAIIPELNHFQLVTSEEVPRRIDEWLESHL